MIRLLYSFPLFVISSIALSLVSFTSLIAVVLVVDKSSCAFLLTALNSVVFDVALSLKALVNESCCCLAFWLKVLVFSSAF